MYSIITALLHLQFMHTSTYFSWMCHNHQYHIIADEDVARAKVHSSAQTVDRLEVVEKNLISENIRN